MPPKFFDIFSKKKISEKKDLIKVSVDIREKNSLVPSVLGKLGAEVEFSTLKVGDYIVKDFVIERKTISDFISSMINKRLSKQLEELQQFDKRLLIIEGFDERFLYSDENHEEFGGMHPNAIRGFLLSILLKHKVPIVYSKNEEDTAKFIITLSKKSEKEVSLNVNKKNLTKHERMQFIIEGFPGIGPKTAKKLLEKFKTLKNLVNASQEELEKEIGKKAEAFKILDEEY